MIVCLSVRLSTHGTGGGELSVSVCVGGGGGGGGGGVCMCTCACTVFVCMCARACVCAHFCAQFRYEVQMIGLPFVHSPRLRLDSLRTFLANLEAGPSVS